MAPKRKRHTIQAPDDAWKRLGELLELRRAELGYRARTHFAEGRLPRTPDGNLNVRLVADIENNYRPGSYPAGTVQEIARAYAVGHGSVIAVLRGEADELIPADPAPPSSPAAADAMAETPAVLREARNLAARIEQLLAASGDPVASEALSGYVDRALRRVQIEVEELLDQARQSTLKR